MANLSVQLKTAVAVTVDYVFWDREPVAFWLAAELESRKEWGEWVEERNRLENVSGAGLRATPV